VAPVEPPPVTLEYTIVDVFTDSPLTGNALAVFSDGTQVPPEKMQRLARELNLSETVFVLPPERGGSARVRIFTPAVELPFAGHPILGAAVVLGERRGVSSIELETGLGPVAVELDRRGGQATFGRMAQPVPSWHDYESKDELLAALGLSGSLGPVEVYENGPRHVYVELGSEPDVAALRPDIGALGALGSLGINCFAGSGLRWKNRMFAPGLGVAEDPATGSAAGPLAVHLARHGRIGFGEEIEIRQGEEIRRPSILFAEARGSESSIEAVLVGGSAVVVAHGAFERI
jgi:trans-2,3-dihydro-3-hydroxyanthranilate isomerase